MKSISSIGLAAAGVLSLSSASFATPANLLDGANVGVDSYIIPYAPAGYPTSQNIDFVVYSGAFGLYSDPAESVRFSNDGGFRIGGAPVRIMLGNNAASDGAFEIWRAGDVHVGTTASPALSVDTGTHLAAFKGVNVSVDSDGTNGGALTVGGKAVLTQGSANSAFGSATATGNFGFAVGYLSSAGGSNSFAGGANSSATTTDTFAFGNSAVADGAFSAALGNGAKAHGPSSIALGFGSTVITGATGAAALSGGLCYGSYSTAMSSGNAQGNYSVAAAGATTQGNYSFAAGLGLGGESFSSTTLGCYNVSVQAGSSSWSAGDPLLTVGNGDTASTTSNSLLMLKNGQTTLTNKYWVGGTHALDPHTGTNQAAGEALVVKGNTRLCGKVVLEQSQGDIGMGIYGAP